MDKIPIGYQALVEGLGLSALPHYCVSYVALQGRGKTISGSCEVHIYPKTYALKDPHDWLRHLEFALKHEGLNLEIIQQVFDKLDKVRIIRYIQDQPTGIYARKMWYLYEFLTQSQLPIDNCQRIKHVNLVDDSQYYTTTPIKSSRHAINDNLLGNRQFCPVVRRTEKIEYYFGANLDHKARVLLEKYDARLIARAGNYLYTKETMSSYQIEREQPSKSRIARFIALLRQASSIETLSKEKLIELQNAIVDPRFADVDYRHNQNYVGENISFHFQKIHYISPKPEDVSFLMQGLLRALERMFATKIHPVIIAAAISFGFVFIHPFEDGNGRIHRFLLHYILSKTNFTPKDILLPISSIMLNKMHDYDDVLESFSKPLMNFLTDYDLTDDGMMTVQQKTRHYYQYIDFTKIVEYLFLCIEELVNYNLEHELMFLANYDKTKIAIQKIVDMPDKQIDLLIKFVLQNKGMLAENKRKKYFSQLMDDELEKMILTIKRYLIKK